jgi:hypothetical protein
MLEAEARWLNQKITKIGVGNIGPLCDIGSSSKDFIRSQQPWIYNYIFKTLEEAKCLVKHVDIKPAPGVDIIGDLSDSQFHEELIRYGFKSVFFSNVLEHLSERESICNLLVSMIPLGGFIFASCPRHYPSHPDPIDTMFRPTVSELSSLFKGTKLLAGDIVKGGTLITNERSILRRVLIIARMMIPAYRPRNWLRNLGYVFEPYSATCVVLQRCL